MELFPFFLRHGRSMSSDIHVGDHQFSHEDLFTTTEGPDHVDDRGSDGGRW